MCCISSFLCFFVVVAVVVVVAVNISSLPLKRILSLNSCASSDELVSVTEVSFSLLFVALLLLCAVSWCCICPWLSWCGVHTDLFDVELWIHVCINSTFEC